MPFLAIHNNSTGETRPAASPGRFVLDIHSVDGRSYIRHLGEKRQNTKQQPAHHHDPGRLNAPLPCNLTF